MALTPELIKRANLGFDIDELPTGYGFIGGAARNLLDAAVHPLDKIPKPRDVDIMYGANSRGFYDGQQARSLAERFAPRDAAHGHGVQVIDDVADYMKTRDFTINQVMVVGDGLWTTDQAVMDMQHYIIRPTVHEHNERFSLGVNLALKAIRLWAEFKVDGIDIVSIKGINLQRDTYGSAGDNSFSQLLNLDKAFERGEEVAWQYGKGLDEHGIYPNNISSRDPIELYKALLEQVYNFTPSPHMEQFLGRPSEQEQERERRLANMGLRG